ncbi:MAG: hypothetical protein B6244_03845 [Candidatus Cloacimonetes bacterium 4572_55]|nr:MAG: hypothetical protein B6244_03845 [Candidatus Cloacimonetes bacterium 4572_55]
MNYSGALRTVSFPDLLQWLGKGNKTGCLTVSNGIHTKHIYFRNGEIIYATSIRDEDRFGGFLVRTEVITEEQLAEALERHEKSGRMIGETLVDMRLLKEEELSRQLKRLNKQIIFDVFTWEDGDFEFFDGHKPPIEVEFQVLNVSQIVEEGEKKVEEWADIRKLIPSMNAVLQIHEDESMRNVVLSSIEFQLLALCDGVKTVVDICDETTLSDFETCRLLAGMISTDFLEIRAVEKKSTTDHTVNRQIVRLIEIYQVPQRIIVEKLEIDGGPLTRLRVDEIYEETTYRFPDLLADTELRGNGTFQKSALIQRLSHIPQKKRMPILKETLGYILTQELKLARAELGRWKTKSLIKEVRAELKPIFSKEDSIASTNAKEELEQVIR